MAKTTAPRATSKAKTTAIKPTAKKTQAQAPQQQVSNDERHRMIQDAAYHIAEKDGFQGGKDHEYWLQAEQQIQERLKDRERSKEMH